MPLRESCAGSSGGGLTSVVTAGCLNGSGSLASPLTVTLNPTGGIQCTAAGLAVQFPASTGLNNVTTVGCLTGNGTAGSPLTISLNSTGLIQCTAGGLAFNGPTGLIANGVQTLGCVSGNGTTVPVQLRIDPTGLIGCGAAGLKLLNAPGVGGGGTEYTSLELQVVGGGTHADPTTEVNLKYNNSSGTNILDVRPMIYFTMGQIGALSADGNIDDQPRFIVPEGFQLETCRVYLTVGNPGITATDVQLQRYNATTDCTEPSTNGTPIAGEILDGCTWTRWTDAEGLTLGSLTQLTFRVLTPGEEATNCVAHFWARATVCFEP